MPAVEALLGRLTPANGCRHLFVRRAAWTAPAQVRMIRQRRKPRPGLASLYRTCSRRAAVPALRYRVDFHFSLVRRPRYSLPRVPEKDYSTLSRLDFHSRLFAVQQYTSLLTKSTQHLASSSMATSRHAIHFCLKYDRHRLCCVHPGTKRGGKQPHSAAETPYRGVF